MTGIVPQGGRAGAEGREHEGRPWPTFGEALRVWARVALLSFGGPAGQIAVMHRILVEEKRWIGEARFLHALNFCMLLPGPEAQQLTVYIGWLLHGVRGGLAAGLLFVAPGAVSILILSVVYALYGDVGWVDAAFFGLKAAVLAIVLQASFRLGRRVLRSPAAKLIAAASFLAIFAFAVPFPLVVLAAGVLGLAAGRVGLDVVPDTANPDSPSAPPHDEAAVIRASGRAPAGKSSLRVCAALLLVWLVPTAILAAILGWDATLTRIAIFFSQMAVLTFGGAYAVLAWVAQAAVETQGWLVADEMLDGLGLAETTPGPLIMVTQFVGFLAAFRDPAGLPPLAAGALGALVSTWVTFAPCFLWIFAAAPHVERLRRSRALAVALSSVTAGVVGVILNLAVWFALHVTFREVSRVTTLGLDMPAPVVATLDPWAALLAAAALFAAFRLRMGLAPLLLSAAGAGLLLFAAGAAPR